MTNISKKPEAAAKTAGIARTDPEFSDSSQPGDLSDKDVENARRTLRGEHGAAESTKRERDHGRPSLTQGD